MPTVGKHTGTGSLLHHDTSDALLCDPDSGLLLWDGNVYFNEDPPDWFPDEYDGWAICRTEWSRRYYASTTLHGRLKSTSTDPDTGQTVKTYYTDSEMQELLDAWYPASDPSSSDTRTVEGYQFVSCTDSATQVQVRIGAMLFRLPQNSPNVEQNVPPTRITVHGLRVGLQYGGTGDFEARWRLFQDEPSRALLGGRVFYAARIRSRVPANRTAYIGLSATYAPDDAPWLYIEVRPRRLHFNTVDGGLSGSLSVQRTSSYRNVYALCEVHYQ